MAAAGTGHHLQRSDRPVGVDEQLRRGAGDHRRRSRRDDRDLEHLHLPHLRPRAVRPGDDDEPDPVLDGGAAGVPGDQVPAQARGSPMTLATSTVRRRRWPVQPAAALLAVLVLLGIPFAVVILTAGKSKAEALEPNLALPSSWHYLENFAQVLSEGRMLAAFLGSVLVMVPAVAIVLVFGAMASWILAR